MKCDPNKIKYRTRKTAWKYACIFYKRYGTGTQVYRCEFGKKHYHLTSSGVFIPPKEFNPQEQEK